MDTNICRTHSHSGPFFGAWVYENMGFDVPFYAIGFLITALAFVNSILLPKIERASKENEDIQQSHKTLTTITFIKVVKNIYSL